MGGERAGLAGRPQPEVDLVERALGGRRRKRRDQALGQARDSTGRRAAAAGRPRRRRVRRNRRGGSDRGRTRRSSRVRRACPWRPARPRRPSSGRAPPRTPCGQRARSAATSTSARSAKAIAGVAGADRAGEHADADQERLLLSEDARPVEHVLVGDRLAERRGKALLDKRRASGSRPKKAGSITASRTWARRMMVSARRGATPMIVASRPRRPGLDLSSAKSCTPAGSRARNRSKAAKAASALSVPASASSSAGTNSVRRSRAVAERVAG